MFLEQSGLADIEESPIPSEAVAQIKPIAHSITQVNTEVCKTNDLANVRNFQTIGVRVK